MRQLPAEELSGGGAGKALTKGEQQHTTKRHRRDHAPHHHSNTAANRAAWGPQDKATKLPRLWLPTAAPVIAGETAWPLDAAQRRKLGKVLRLRGATSCACLMVVWGSGSRL